jgi:chromosome segregation ATPase
LDAETQLAGLVDALKKARVAIDMTGSRVADWAALHTEARAAINQALAPSQAADIIERQQAALQSAEQRATKLAEENGALERARAVGMERICDLEADRDKLAGEVERLKEVTVGPLSYTAMRARAEAAEAQLAGVVDALKRIASLKFANTPGLNVEPSPLDAFNTAQHIARQVLASILVMRAPE